MYASPTEQEQRINGHLASYVFNENTVHSASNVEIHDEYKNVVIKTLGYGCQMCFLASSAIHISEFRYSEPDNKTGKI
jgi:hypothetical protein